MRTIAVLAAAVVTAGCSAGQPASRGRLVFHDACARCHTLTGHDTNASGGDLRVGHLTAAQVASFVKAMPIDPPLDRSDTRAVARFVATR